MTSSPARMRTIGARATSSQAGPAGAEREERDRRLQARQTDRPRPAPGPGDPGAGQGGEDVGHGGQPGAGGHRGQGGPGRRARPQRLDERRRQPADRGHGHRGRRDHVRGHRPQAHLRLEQDQHRSAGRLGDQGQGQRRGEPPRQAPGQGRAGRPLPHQDARRGRHRQGEAVVARLPGVDEHEDQHGAGQGRHGDRAAPRGDAGEHDGAHDPGAQHRAARAHEDDQARQHHESRHRPHPPGHRPEPGQHQAQDEGDVLARDGGEMGH